ncbi:molybdopterin-binding protein [Halosimplex rubrum]|uniref:molybdopterin-binding protein n=1 Tax=Halosimplex rubrum TaxID=869889 RepID=UPI001C54E760
MVDFQSRDTSRGYGDDEDEEADAEGGGAEAAEDEPADEPVEGEPEAGAEPTEPEPADEPAVETEGVDAGESESGDATGSDPGASDGESDADAAESGGDPLAGSSGGASGDPLAPDTAAAGAASPEADTETDPSTDDTEPETTDDGRGADSPADDPLSSSSGSVQPSEVADGPDDHPFADDETDAEAAVETDAETAVETDPGAAAEHAPSETDRREVENSGGARTDDRADSGGHSHDTDDPSHDSGSHSHDTDDRSHDSAGHSHDHAHGAEVGLLGVAVVTVSSTRTRENDPSGDVIEALIEAADHEVVTREILRDDLDGVQTALLNLTGRDDVDVVVTTGGTGVTPDDVTVEGARPLFDRELPGFGELFRILSYEEIGTRAMVSRATAGMVDGVPVFCLPGSEAAARLGTEELVVEEMAHLVSLARRDD